MNFVNRCALAADHTPSVGFVTEAFPRDTIEFGKYSEQAIAGQVLETLVTANANGELSPMLARSWQTLDEGKTLRFSLRRDVVFSNGKPLSSDDIIYSIERHRKDDRSQSHDLLTDVLSLHADDPHTVTIKLKRPRVAIFKVLSRDQLGIVPKGWFFDEAAQEPMVGTGPYRLVREGGDWLLIRNERFHSLDQVSVQRWRLVRSDDPEDQIRAGTIPTVVLAATERQKDLVEAAESGRPVHKAEEQISFLQTSIWWHPHGARYGDSNFRHFVMGVMRDLVTLRRTKASWACATGLLPLGVSGYLPTPVHFSPTERPQALATQQTIDIRIAVYKSFRSMFFADELHAKIEKRYNIRFNVLDYADPATLPAQHPDVAIDSWFGGFNDPEGFLLLLPGLLQARFDEYLGDIRPIYERALFEQNWQVRTELFRTFNRMLVEQEKMVPTWRVPTYSLVGRGYRQRSTIFRYTPRLTDIVIESDKYEGP